MADFEAPSFSLGLDLDLDLDSDHPVEESLPQSAPIPPINETTFRTSRRNDDGDDFHVVGTLDPDPPPLVLKRLRRGPLKTPSSSAFGRPESLELPLNVDDSTDEFSSEEDRRRDENSSMQNRSACSSSKFSLHGQRFQSSQSASKLNDKKNRPASNASTGRNFEASSSQWIFPKLTISPLRKIHLLDSDCDDPLSINDQPKDVKRVGASAKGSQYDPAQYEIGNQQKKEKISSNMLQTDDFWKDFTPKKNIKLAIPAPDEFCEEYFRSMKYVNVGPGTKEDIGMSSTTSLASNYILDEAELRFQKNNFREDLDHCGSLPNLLPPAYRYFHHNDPRIQRLVRDRLCYFFPIGAASQGRNQHSETATIDYMGQFGQRDTPTQYPSQVDGTVNRGLKESSKKNNNLNNSNLEEAPQPSGNWVNPKSRGAILRHAGKKRVRADGCSAGASYWYTGQDGRKVYFTKNGQELTGRTAYRHYRKENGGGFKRVRKKAASKKNSNKAASKKSSNKAASKMRSNKTGIKKRSKR